MLREMAPERTILALERLVLHGGTLTSRVLQSHPETSGLSVSQYRLFVLVTTGDNLHVGELARRLGASSQTTTRLVQRLEARGLVTSARGTADRRMVIVRPTPRAVELWRVISDQRRASFRDALAGLTIDDESLAALEQLADGFARATH